MHNYKARIWLTGRIAIQGGELSMWYDSIPDSSVDHWEVERVKWDIYHSADLGRKNCSPQLIHRNWWTLSALNLKVFTPKGEWSGVAKLGTQFAAQLLIASIPEKGLMWSWMVIFLAEANVKPLCRKISSCQASVSLCNSFPIIISPFPFSRLHTRYMRRTGNVKINKTVRHRPTNTGPGRTS